MKKKYFAALPWLLSLAVAFGQGPQPFSGKIIRHENFPSRYVAPRHVDVWLPEDYDPSSRRYAVVYMHDGQMLFDAQGTWNGQEWGVDETLSRLLSIGALEDLMVVGVWNNGKYRRSEYAPQRALAYLAPAEREALIRDHLEGEPRADAYLRFLVEELKPFVDSVYATRPGRDHTALMGSSMGGLISLYGLCEYPDVFGKAACLSTHWPGALPVNAALPNALLSYLEERMPDPGGHVVYFDYGTAGLDSLYAPYQARADHILRKKGYGAREWATLAFAGADHHERAWAERLYLPFLFLFRRAD